MKFDKLTPAQFFSPEGYARFTTHSTNVFPNQKSLMLEIDGAFRRFRDTYGDIAEALSAHTIREMNVNGNIPSVASFVYANGEEFSVFNPNLERPEGETWPVLFPHISLSGISELGFRERSIALEGIVVRDGKFEGRQKINFDDKVYSANAVFAANQEVTVYPRNLNLIVPEAYKDLILEVGTTWANYFRGGLYGYQTLLIYKGRTDIRYSDDPVLLASQGTGDAQLAFGEGARYALSSVDMSKLVLHRNDLCVSLYSGIKHSKGHEGLVYIEGVPEGTILLVTDHPQISAGFDKVVSQHLSKSGQDQPIDFNGIMELPVPVYACDCLYK
ncbi:MAG: hypothetical protein HGA85_05350 [Nanoarchaeota archaeon]|nr:hypothetical protein [Nanoarchaeota archaeon]